MFFLGFFGWVFWVGFLGGFFWVGFLLPTLLLGDGRAVLQLLRGVERRAQLLHRAVGGEHGHVRQL